MLENTDRYKKSDNADVCDIASGCYTCNEKTIESFIAQKY